MADRPPEPTATDGTATETSAACCASSSPTCARTARSCARSGRAASREAQLLTALTPGGDLLRGDVGLRQLRRGARDRLGRGAAGLRAQPVRAHHPPRRRDRRGRSASCCCCATCWPARCSRSTSPTSHSSTASSTPTSRPPTASPTRWRVNFVQERERVIRQQQEAIRELSTPVLQVRERLLILPIIGVLDGQRARQLTEQLLRGIRANRAKVVVIDITGVPTIDSTVANHLVQTVDASRLMGASVIITGLSLGDRADAGDARRRPVEGQRGRRPPGRHRGGRAAARLRGHRSGDDLPTEAR